MGPLGSLFRHYKIHGSLQIPLSVLAFLFVQLAVLVGFRQFANFLFPRYMSTILFCYFWFFGSMQCRGSAGGLVWSVFQLLSMGVFFRFLHRLQVFSYWRIFLQVQQHNRLLLI